MRRFSPPGSFGQLPEDHRPERSARGSGQEQQARSSARMRPSRSSGRGSCGRDAAQPTSVSQAIESPRDEVHWEHPSLQRHLQEGALAIDLTTAGLRGVGAVGVGDFISQHARNSRWRLTSSSSRLCSTIDPAAAQAILSAVVRSQSLTAPTSRSWVASTTASCRTKTGAPPIICAISSGDGAPVVGSRRPRG